MTILALARFEQLGLLVALPIGLTCAMLSVFVVLRRMAFIGQGVSHAGFGGIALSVLLGNWFAWLNQPLARNVLTAAFCVATALMIGILSRRKRVHEDAAIGILLVATMAMGSAFIGIRVYVLHNTEYVPAWSELLFGSILTVTRGEVIGAYVFAGAIVLTVLGLYKEFVSYTYDETMARIEGLPTRLLHVLLLVMLSITIVLGLRAVGFLMISALLILPASTANLLSRRFNPVMLLSVLVGVGGTLGGLWLSLRVFDFLESGAMIVLTLVAIFLVVFILTGAASLLKRPR